MEIKLNLSFVNNKDNTNYSYGYTHEFDYSFDYDYPDLELNPGPQAALITLYTVTTALSVFGNSLVISVLILGQKTQTVLSKFLINMAAADLLMALFCIPFNFTNTMLGHWIFGAVMCPIALFIMVTSVAVSIFTNTAIGIDR